LTFKMKQVIYYILIALLMCSCSKSISQEIIKTEELHPAAETYTTTWIGNTFGDLTNYVGNCARSMCQRVWCILLHFGMKKGVTLASIKTALQLAPWAVLKIRREARFAVMHSIFIPPSSLLMMAALAVTTAVLKPVIFYLKPVQAGGMQ
jgi:hypothetical protein